MVSDSEFRKLAERAHEMLCIVDSEGRFAYANPAWSRVLGWLPTELMGTAYIDLVHPDDVNATLAVASSLNDGKDVVAYTNRYRTKDGFYRDIQWWSRAAEGEFIYATANDFTEIHRSKSRAAEIEEVSGVFSWEQDVDSKEIYWSPGTKRLFQWTEERHPTLEEVYAFAPVETQQILGPCVARVLEFGEPYDIEALWHRIDGSTFLARATGAAEMRDGQVLRIYGTLEDVTERRRMEQEALERERELRKAAEAAYNAENLALQKQAWTALHDPLTGIGNRKFLDETLSTLEEKSLLVLMIDLDRFKHINDSFGHEAGDHVLIQTAERLKHAGAATDHIFRIGGDEFAMLIDLEDQTTSPQDFCDWLLDRLLEAVEFNGIELHFGASIGFAICGRNASAKDALRRADMALYEAKTQGRSRVLAYTATIGAAYLEKVKLANDLQTALENGEIGIALQPQVCASSRDLIGCEALARWHHPKRGTVPPNVFIPLAEELNLITEVDKAVLKTALQAKSSLVQHGIELPKISVNVSARRISSPTLLEELDKMKPVVPGELAFEVLETAFLDSIEDDLNDQLDAIRTRGISIEVDDFGTGHASFASVLALKPDVLKIDRIFVPGIDSDKSKQELMLGLIQIAKNVGAKTLVEGVETPVEAQVLCELGVDYLQGYTIARPMTVEQLLDWISTQTTVRMAG